MRAEVKFHFPDGVILGGVGDGLREDLIDAVQVPQQHAFGPLEFVVADVIGEGAERLEHLPRDGFGPDVLLAHPGMLVRKGVEGRVDELAVRLGVFQLLQLFDALVVFDPGHLHLGHLLALQLVELLAQDDVRVFQDGLHEREQDQRVIRLLRVHQRQRLQQIQRERLVHRKVVLQLDVDAELRSAAVPSRTSASRARCPSAPGQAEVRPVSFNDLPRRAGTAALPCVGKLNDPPLHQRAEKLPGAFDVGLLGLGRVVAAGDQLLHRAAAVALAAEHVEQHPVRDLETRGQALRLGGDQAEERVLVPVDEVLLRRLAFDHLLAVPGRLLFQLQVLDHVLGRLGNHPAALVEPLAPGPPANLVKIPRAQDAGLLAVILAKPREQHGADGDVDARRRACRCRK